jgi:hypothetical protein
MALLLQGFIEKLKRRLLPRILEKLGYTNDVAKAVEDQWSHIVFKGNRIYSHKLFKVNHTTYDIRRDQDVVHVDTAQCNVMLLNGQYTPDTRTTVHPYLYGKVLGIFHADVAYVGRLPDTLKTNAAYHRLDFLWVNWYQLFKATTEFALDSVTLYPAHLNGSLSFVDPSNVIRGVHLIPQFSSGKASVAPRSRFVGTGPTLWSTYYINRFVWR